MNLVDRYVREIGRRLPQKTRADIEKEIRSAVEDMLDDQSQKEGRGIDEEMTVKVLKEYGEPEKVAASYLPERHLIGPTLFPVFWLVVQIVFGVLTAMAIIGLGIHIFSNTPAPAELGKTTFSLVTQYFGGLMSAFGNIVLIFALLEYFAPRLGWNVKDEKEEKDDWNPRDLPNVEDVNRVSVGETSVEIVFTVLALVLFNLYPEYIGIYNFSDQGSSFVPILSQAFFSYMPWLNMLWGAQIALDVWLIQQSRWQVGSRLLFMAIKAGSAAAAYGMLIGPSIISLSAEVLRENLFMPADAAQTVASIIVQVAKFALIINIIVNAVEIVKALVKMVRAQIAPAAA